MIHICFALYDKTGRYSKFVGTTICSIFENSNYHSQSITIHILHDNTLSTNNREKFIYLAGQYGQLVKFYNVEELCADEIEEIKLLAPRILESRYSIATFYRFLIPNLLPSDISKAIYLDADIIVNLDINELWQIDLGDKMLATVPEIKCNHINHARDSKSKFLITSGFVAYEDYFCAGILLLNLNRLRVEKDSLKDGMKFLNEHPQMKLFDQDVLNYLYSKDYVKIHEKFDAFVNHERSLKRPLRSAIYHYVVGCLNLNMSDVFNRLWMKYFIKTPWFDVDTMGRLYNVFRKIYGGLKQSMINLSTLMIDKTRAFFIAPQSVDSIKKIFSIRDDEEIILAEGQSSLQKLIDAMNASRGKKVFFIMLKKFPFQILMQAGFVAGRDFVDGFYFLSEAHGVPHDSRPIVKVI